MQPLDRQTNPPSTCNSKWNDDNGVTIIEDLATTTTGNRILSNSIHDNGMLGIDLSCCGEVAGTVNSSLDDGDGDGGPNRSQNFPVITSAANSGRKTLIEGTLNSTPSTPENGTQTFTIQFFSNPAADPSGYGEGQKFLGQRRVTTDASGNASFSFATRSKNIPQGEVVSTTATNQSTSDTSEFSEDEPVS